jgi:NDP-sugar pyrophosphorylase family protein
LGAGFFQFGQYGHLYYLPSGAVGNSHGEVFDFAKDLFPKLLSAGRPVYGVEMKGYWCDIGDTDAYRRCVVDALNGLISLQAALPKNENGIYAREGMPILPKDVVLTPPLYIEPSAQNYVGGEIGPNVVLGPSAYVGEESIVTDSLVEGSIGPAAKWTARFFAPAQRWAPDPYCRKDRSSAAAFG